MSEITLFTPGPTHIPNDVFQAMSRGDIHHRTSEFRSIFQETTELLQSVFESSTRPLFLACSGTGLMEAALVNSVDEQHVLGFLNAGKFGERWGDIARHHGMATAEFKLPWGESLTSDTCVKFLFENPSITHFALQYCETSTAVLHDVPALVTAIRKNFPDMVIIVDAISAATTVPISLSKLPIDALILASQKAFMLPPGLGMIFLSDRYVETMASARSLYFNFREELRCQNKGNSAWTPALHHILGLRHVLHLFENEGWDSVYLRHQQCSDYCHQQFSSFGITPVAPEHRAPGVSGGFISPSKNADEVRAKLFSQFGMQIAGGQDEWKGKVLRFGHMGIVSPHHLESCFQKLGEVLSQ